jgi:hypothetical protein
MFNAETPANTTLARLKDRLVRNRRSQPRGALGVATATAASMRKAT